MGYVHLYEEKGQEAFFFYMHIQTGKAMYNGSYLLARKQQNDYV